MSLARQHRDRVLASLSAAASPSDEGGLALPVALANDPAAVAAAQMAMRLTHDQRRLKQIQSIEKRIEVKREMLPEYEAWVAGILAEAKANTDAAIGPIVPTIMVWKIDTGDYRSALELAEYVLLNRVPLPDQYKRQPATLIVEEIAEAALRDNANGREFPLDILEDVELLTADEDMPDEVRAKLFKAIGLEYNRRAEIAEADSETGADARAAQDRALAGFRRAQELDARVGVKDRIKKIERAIAKAPTVPPAEPATPASTPAEDTNTEQAGSAS